MPVLERLRAEHADGRVLVVAHQALLRLLLCALLEIPLDRYRGVFPGLDNVAPTVVRLDGSGAAALLALNVPLAMNPRSRRPLARASAGEDRDGMAHVPVHHLEARLETPRVAVAPSLRAAARAFGDDGMDAYLADVVGLADAELPAYVDGLRADRLEDSPRPRGLVPATHLWWVAGVEYLGRVHLRHRLTPALWEVGGHLGYHVVPPHRRRGHATAMLAETLPFAAALGIDELLVTCDVDNEASRRVIEANGGELEDRRGVKLRFWVPTSASG